MNDENQGPIQLKPTTPIFTGTPKQARKIIIPKRMIILSVILVLIVLVIIIVTFLPIRPKGDGTTNGSKFQQISPAPTTEINLPEITDPTLKSINDKISQLQNELKNPFNYQELLSVPIIDLNISF